MNSIQRAIHLRQFADVCVFFFLFSIFLLISHSARWLMMPFASTKCEWATGAFGATCKYHGNQRATTNDCGGETVDGHFCTCVKSVLDSTVKLRWLLFNWILMPNLCVRRASHQAHKYNFHFMLSPWTRSRVYFTANALRCLCHFLHFSRAERDEETIKTHVVHDDASGW